MHVNTFNVEIGGFYNSFNMSNLVNGNAKFTVDMASGNFKIASCHDMRIQPNANGITITECIAELFQNRDIIDVDIHTEFFSFNHFVEVDTVRRKQYIFLVETSQ